MMPYTLEVGPMGDAMVHSREWIEGCALAKQEAEYGRVAGVVGI